MKNSLTIIFLSLLIASCARIDSNAPIIYNHNKAHRGDNTGSRIPIIDADGNFAHQNSREISSSSAFQKEEIIDPNSFENQLSKNPPENPETNINHAFNSQESNAYDLNHSVLKEEKTIFHEVRSGETIEDIALFYEQSVEEIAKLNHLKSPYRVEALQSLRIRVPKDYEKQGAIAESKTLVETSTSYIFVKPVDGEIISKFGKSSGAGSDQGINIASKAGNKVKAAAAGTVIYSDYDATFGNLVIIKLDDKNMVTAYAHLQDLVVKKGDKIGQGSIVGYVGSSGKVDQSQLYFAIREGKKPVDPLKYVRY